MATQLYQQLQKWDGAYYSEKLKKELFDLDQEILKPYFKLENVIDGVFEVATRLFDLHFKEVFNVEKYHEDVKTYDVTDKEGSLIYENIAFTSLFDFIDSERWLPTVFSFASSDFFHDAVVEGHGESWVKDQDDGVKDDLVTDWDVPISNKIGVLTHTLRVALEVIVWDEGSDDALEGNWEEISLNLNKSINTRRVIRTVVAT